MCLLEFEYAKSLKSHIQDIPAMARPKCLMRDFTNLNRIYKMSDESWKFFGYITHYSTVATDGLVLKQQTISIDSGDYIDGLVQDCSNSIANALELLQSCTKPSIYSCTGLNTCRNVYCEQH